jgi:hypothetical protein
LRLGSITEVRVLLERVAILRLVVTGIENASTPLERVLDLLDGVRGRGGGYVALCPAHDDRQPSLSVGEADTGKVILHCHAGCPTKSVLEALGLEWVDLCPSSADQGVDSPEAIYEYTDSKGAPLFEVVRYPGKRFLQRRPDPDSPDRYCWNLDGVEPVLYRLPAVLAAVEAGEVVFVVEGEKDVEALEQAGAIATCNPGGAGKWRSEYSEQLRGAQVIVVADLDEPGRGHAVEVVQSLTGVAGSVKLVEPGAGKDAADHLAAGQCTGDFRPCGDAASAELAPLLDEVRVFLRRYVVLSDAQLAAVALWVAHTHAFAAAETTPYLEICSAEKESGKTRLLETLELVVARPWLTGRMSISALARRIDAEQPTLLLDESDALFASDRAYVQDLRGILNSGFRRGGSHTINVPAGQNGWAPADFSVFSAKAIAGIGNLPDTIASRSISIRLKRRRPDELVERFRHRRAHDLAAPLRDRLEQFLPKCVERLAELIEAEPEMPSGLSDRAEDVWEPLLAIADLAGGDWPDRAREAAVELSGNRGENVESVGVRLLGDIRSIFDQHGRDQIGSAELVSLLILIEESPWGGWNRGKGLSTHTLARQLKGFGITPGHTRDGSARGYSIDQFDDVFARYLEPTAEESVKASNPVSAAPAPGGASASPDGLTVARTTGLSDDVEATPDLPPAAGSIEDADAEYERIRLKFPDLFEEGS